MTKINVQRRILWNAGMTKHFNPQCSVSHRSQEWWVPWMCKNWTALLCFATVPQCNGAPQGLQQFQNIGAILAIFGQFFGPEGPKNDKFDGLKWITSHRTQTDEK